MPLWPAALALHEGKCIVECGKRPPWADKARVAAAVRAGVAVDAAGEPLQVAHRESCVLEREEMGQMKIMDPLFDFSGKVVLVTGGSRGLGYQMVRAFAERGADLVVTSRRQESCEAVAEEVRAMGRRALAYGCHVGHWEELDGLVEAAYAEYGRVDVLINNAGMSPVTPTSADVSEALFDKVIGVNFKGPFRLCALVGHRMARAGGGCIINVSSSAAIRPIPNAIPYCGAKAALNAMTEAFAAEFGGAGVRVNSISAGPFLTDISKAWREEDRQTAPSALGRPGRPEEVVTTALYLASPHSTFVTACLARVDGGL